MIVDYHTHTSLCKHAEGTAEDYIKSALARGLTEIGCSDHSPMPNDFDLKHRMTMDQFKSDYQQEIISLQSQYRSRISVKFGIEADFYPGTEEWMEDFLNSNAFDYVIGSIHYLGEWGFDNPIFVHKYEEQNVDEIYEQYYDYIKRSASCRLFDILGHCDLVKKFGHRPAKNIEEVLREVFKVVKAADMAVEINTSGLRKPAKEVYPSEQILRIIRDYRIPVTIGSDAHRPDDVAKDFQTARQLIQTYGNGKAAVFRNRQRSEVTI